MVLLGLTIVYFAMRYQKKQLLHLRKIKDLNLIHENNLLMNKLQIQEQTFQNISREVHDNIGQKLTLAKLQLNTLVHTDPEINERIKVVVQIITESLNDLRDISRSLSSEIIINNGLIKALENEINHLNKSCQYSIKLIITGEPIFMDSETELVIFRMIQESLSNIIKHAEATQVKISFVYSENQLFIEVHDNGKGFDTSENKNGNGLSNIKSRAASLNGVAVFESEKQKGTVVKIRIPYLENINKDSN